MSSGNAGICGALKEILTGRRTAETSDNQPEQDALGVLISGDDIYSFHASESLEAGEAVKHVEDYTVGPCDDIDEFYGLALFDVTEGEEVAVVEAPAEVWVTVADPVEPNDGVTLKDSTTWKLSENRQRAIVRAHASAGERAEIELRPELNNR